MDYYDEKLRVFNIIEQRIKKSDDGIDEKFLIYDLTKIFRVGELTIKKRLKLLEEIGKITNTAGVLQWKGKKKK